MQPLAELRCTLRVPWLALIRVLLPPRVLLVSSHMTFGILLWELLCHVQIGGIFVLFVDEIDLARIAPSCHFALVLL